MWWSTIWSISIESAIENNELDQFIGLTQGINCNLKAFSIPCKTAFHNIVYADDAIQDHFFRTALLGTKSVASVFHSTDSASIRSMNKYFQQVLRLPITPLTTFFAQWFANMKVEMAPLAYYLLENIPTLTDNAFLISSTRSKIILYQIQSNTCTDSVHIGEYATDLRRAVDSFIQKPTDTCFQTFQKAAHYLIKTGSRSLLKTPYHIEAIVDRYPELALLAIQSHLHMEYKRVVVMRWFNHLSAMLDQVEMTSRSLKLLVTEMLKVLHIQDKGKYEVDLTQHKLWMRKVVVRDLGKTWEEMILQRLYKCILQQFIFGDREVSELRKTLLMEQVVTYHSLPVRREVERIELEKLKKIALQDMDAAQMLVDLSKI